MTLVLTHVQHVVDFVSSVVLQKTFDMFDAVRGSFRHHRSSENASEHSFEKRPHPTPQKNNNNNNMKTSSY